MDKILKKREKIFKKALQKWGFKAQSIILMEECAELIKAVSKMNRTDNPDFMYEEIADVQIMIEQMIHYYGEEAEEKILKNYKNKIKRLEERLNESKADI